MKNILRRLDVKLLLVFAVVFALRVFADSIEDQVPTESWLLAILQFLTTLKGLGAMAIAAGVAQLVLMLGKTPLANVAGKWRLVLVSLVSVAALVLGGMATGLDLKGALALGPVLSAVQVFVHQLWKQLLTPAGEVVANDLVHPVGR